MESNNVFTGKTVEEASKITNKDIASYLEMYRPADFFTVKEPRLEVPERARIFASYACERCGEVAGERWMHMQDGHMLCQDCYHDYDRFHV